MKVIHDGMKKIIRIFLIVIGLGLFYVLVCLGLILSKVNSRPEKLIGYEAILVLGSKIESSRRPAEVTKDRLDAAIKFAKLNPTARIVVSGAKGENEPITEAAGMENYLVKQGIPKRRIIQESHARNTYENLKYSRRLVRGKVLLVTSDFHIYRSLFLAGRLGYKNIRAYAARTRLQSPLNATGYYVPEIFSLGRTLIFGR